MRPLIKWVGGKTTLQKKVVSKLGNMDVYHEPFLGGAAIALFVLRYGFAKHAFLSDKNSSLIGMYQRVQDSVEDVIAELQKFPVKGAWKDSYYLVRSEFNRCKRLELVNPTQAARFIWLNKAGFNGLYRENAKGLLNTPVGDYRVVDLPAPGHLRKVSALLQRATLKVQSFEDSITAAQLGSAVYLDPPYLPAADGEDFTNYTAGGFSVEQHRRLSELALFTSRRGVRVVASNSDTALTRRIYSNFSISALDVHRGMNAARTAAEVLMVLGGAWV